METTSTNKKPNRLINEKSPYLLQHAYNPVDWYPWSEEAFKKAKKENKPVFLSIGYSTCFWCHVMARESFEDEEVAQILNENFVAVKVDREERPDIDHIYMGVCQRFTGQGGWPLTIIMTPDGKPFFAGTYFPRESKWGRPGLLDLLEQVIEKWTNEQDRMKKIGEEVIRKIQPKYKASGEELGEEIIHEAEKALARHFDRAYGSFSQAPKFPVAHNFMFLLRYRKKYGDKLSYAMIDKSLLSMYKGGIFDHIGFGFARYSTDRKWLVPHFEKMLYDNALLAYTYLEAYQVMGYELYARVAEDIFTYILRDMTSPEGGFYSAEDAESEGVEGKFYLWSPDEVNNVLGPEDGKVFCRLYDITGKGNFSGLNIPNLIKSGLNNPGEILRAVKEMDALRIKLLNERNKRVRPNKDDKILTSWNGLMIAALAKGMQVLQDETYKDVAVKALDFIWQKLRRQDGRLLARYRDGEAAYPGYLDDYAFLAWGLLELYEATFDPVYLEKAVKLTDEMIDLFADRYNGGFFFYGRDAEELIIRPKELYDGAIPSGNSVATLNLLRLARMTGSKDYEVLAEKQVKFYANEVKQFPQGYTFFLTALQFALAEPKEVVVVGDPAEEDTKVMLESLQKEFLPEVIVLYYPKNDEGKKMEQLIPFLKEYRSINGKATAYLCKNYACQEPTTDINELLDYARW